MVLIAENVIGEYERRFRIIGPTAEVRSHPSDLLSVAVEADSTPCPLSARNGSCEAYVGLSP